MKKSLIIFDLDGTLADTTEDLGLAMIQMLDELHFPGRCRSELISYISLGARDFVRCCLPAARQNDEALLDRALAIYLEKYRECCVANTVLYAGVEDLLARLRADAYLLCVLSNKPDFFTQKIIRRLLPNVFDQVLGYSDMPQKPDPAAALYLAESFCVLPEACVVVGDSDLDLQTARNAGMASLCVSYGYRSKDCLRAAGAERIVDSPSEIYDAIRSM